MSITQRVLNRQSIVGFSRWQSFTSRRNFERALLNRGAWITWINYSTVYVGLRLGSTEQAAPFFIGGSNLLNAMGVTICRVDNDTLYFVHRYFGVYLLGFLPAHLCLGPEYSGRRITRHCLVRVLCHPSIHQRICPHWQRYRCQNNQSNFYEYPNYLLDYPDKEANSTPLLRTTTGVQNPSELAAVVS